MCLSEEKTRELPEDISHKCGRAIYKKMFFDRCKTLRPDRQFLNGKYRIIDRLCFPDFLENYYLMPKPNDDSAHDKQPDILADDLIHRYSAA